MIFPVRKVRHPINPINAALISETVAQEAVIETQPARRPEAAASKSNLLVSSFFINQEVIGLKTIVEMQLEAPQIVVTTITLAGILFSLTYEIEKELPPLNINQLQKSMIQPAVTKVGFAG